ncbi:MAG: SDR family NAD(P)-dependent oxidoreductase [Gammaproteobacteria bacterium]
MNALNGKTAIITGGAEGIGLSIAQAFAKQGAHIVLADIDGAQLQIAEKTLLEMGIPALCVTMDVAEPTQWQHLVEQAEARFGDIHILVNNAGVGGRNGSIESTEHKDWQWVTDVNMMGVLYGMQAVVPRIKQHGAGGHIINVASMAGMMGVPYAGAYTATKGAVVSLSESWHHELKRHQIYVSVLCPAFVKTRINLSERNRQARYRSDKPATAPSEKQLAAAAYMQNIIDNGLAVEIVGERVVEALKAKELYIFTHPNYRQLVQQRYKAIDDAFERAAASPLLAHIRDEEPAGFSG